MEGISSRSVYLVSAVFAPRPSGQNSGYVRMLTSCLLIGMRFADKLFRQRLLRERGLQVIVLEG